MGNLYKLAQNGTAGFTRKFGYALEKKLFDEGYKTQDVEVSYLDLSKNCGHILSWSYKEKFAAEIMITLGRGDDTNKFIIDRFLGIRSCSQPSLRIVSSADELRAVANIDDVVSDLCNEIFGKSFSEHDGREVYKVRLEVFG